MPTRRLGSSLTAEQVSEQLEGLMSAHTLRKRARQGLVPGAFKVGHRVFFARNTALWLMRDLSSASPAGFAITMPKEESANGFFTPS